MAKRKQLNIGLAPEDFEKVREAAEAEKITITAYCRRAILESVEPPELPESQPFDGIPAWLIHVMLFFARHNNGRHSKT